MWYWLVDVKLLEMDIYAMLMCSVPRIGTFHLSEMAAKFSISKNNVSTSLLVPSFLRARSNLDSIATTTCCMMARNTCINSECSSWTDLLIWYCAKNSSTSNNLMILIDWCDVWCTFKYQRFHWTYWSLSLTLAWRIILRSVIVVGSSTILLECVWI